ncbi:HepT-like ribonuclease domain-containing protein [Poseidonibacter lekithochrous]|nr:HepT-like ribonuclease domain-containing protein [Poseidonibacter lekithochrous]
MKKGIRDILFHHYFDVDAETIFDISKNKMPKLSKVVNQIRLDLSDIN